MSTLLNKYHTLLFINGSQVVDNATFVDWSDSDAGAIASARDYFISKGYHVESVTVSQGGRVFAMLSWEKALGTKVDGKPHPAQPTRSHSHGDPIPPLRGDISLTSWMLQEHHRSVLTSTGSS